MSPFEEKLFANTLSLPVVGDLMNPNEKSKPIKEHVTEVVVCIFQEQ